MAGKFTLITGANRGLGLEMVDVLARRQSDTTLLLGTRSLSNGKSAIDQLNQRGVKTANIQPIQIDQADKTSIANAVSTIKSQYSGRIDTLYANAGILKDGDDPQQSAKSVMEVNYFGVQDLVNALIPLIPKGGHIVIVSSEVGAWSHNATGGQLREQLDHPEKLEVSQVDKMVNDYVASQGSGGDASAYPSGEKTFGPYGISKMFVSTYGRILARELKDKGITVALVCPGYCATDLNGHGGPRKAITGAKSIVYGERISHDQTGGFFQDARSLPMATSMDSMDEMIKGALESERKFTEQEAQQGL